MSDAGVGARRAATLILASIGAFVTSLDTLALSHRDRRLPARAGAGRLAAATVGS
jgi:hypothetical protein